MLFFNRPPINLTTPEGAARFCRAVRACGARLIVLDSLIAAFAGADDADKLEQVKARYLGKSGTLTQLLKGLSKLPAAERPAFGSRVNTAKETLEAAIVERRTRKIGRAHV